MKTQTTDAVILKRTNYGEADRIVTLLTKDAGKLRVMARGIRKSTSKLAGGLELFSETSIVYIKGRGEIDTLVSTKLRRHYGAIVADLEKSRVAYDVLKAIDTVTEDAYEQEFYTLLTDAFAILQEVKKDPRLTWAWFLMQLLRLSGHEPELTEDVDGEMLVASATYSFDFQAGRFRRDSTGSSADHIKFLRLLGGNDPIKLERVAGLESILSGGTRILEQAAQYYLHIKPIA